MRIVAALAAMVFAASCSVDPDSGEFETGLNEGGYTLEARVSDTEQVFLVTAPDGRQTAGRAVEGASALMDASAIQALADAPIETGQHQEVFGLRLPGVDLSVRGDADGSGDGGSVSLDIGGQSVEIDAQDGGVNGSDRANIRITGVDEAEAREFIAKADQLSPGVQAQMLAQLGLE